MHPGNAQPPSHTGRPASRFFLGLSIALFTGRTVDHHAQGDGENVKVATPFGGVSVKTDDSVVLADTGLPQYPGAEMVPKHTRMARIATIPARRTSI